jgi:hypothetical protein
MVEEAAKEENGGFDHPLEKFYAVQTQLFDDGTMKIL